jgi:hypothetical protein
MNANKGIYKVWTLTDFSNSTKWSKFFTIVTFRQEDSVAYGEN